MQNVCRYFYFFAIVFQIPTCTPNAAAGCLCWARCFQSAWSRWETLLSAKWPSPSRQGRVGRILKRCRWPPPSATRWSSSPTSIPPPVERASNSTSPHQKSAQNGSPAPHRYCGPARCKRDAKSSASASNIRFRRY